MPCRSDYDDDFRMSYPAQGILDEYKNEIDFVTRVACEALTILDKLAKNGSINGYNLLPEHEEWWKRHKEFDRSEGR